MKKRIIPCLDIRAGRVVKGKKFKDIQDVADPVTLAKAYEQDQADVLFMLDITGEDRDHFLQIVRNVKQAIDIPIYVGGGIRSVEDVLEVLEAGATKASITSAAITNPSLIKSAADLVGKDKIVLSIDAGKVGEDKWHAFLSGGKKDAELDVIEWAKQGEKDGASEILLNSIDEDGVKSGYNISLNQAVANAVNIPVIASGGAGEMMDFKEVFEETNVNAALAASVFHYADIHITDLKEFLLNFSIDVEEV